MVVETIYNNGGRLRLKAALRTGFRRIVVPSPIWEESWLLMLEKTYCRWIVG